MNHSKSMNLSHELGSGPSPASSATMLALYRLLFDALDRDGVAYCVWKNLNELPDALSGRGDIDLHVRPHSRAAFFAVLRAHGFVRVETHKSYPWIMHYYGFDEPSATLCHLHCYFRFVTGESHIKQYVIPLERYLDVLPDTRNAFGVREMDPWLQGRMHLFRRRIKLSCLPGALLFHREREGYLAEGALLERRERAAEGRRPAIDGWPAALDEASGPWREIVAGFRYRRRFRHWSRFPPFATPIARYAVVAVRALGKLRGWRKTLPLGQLVMVASGEERAADAVRRELEAWLGAELRVRAFRLPDGDGGTSARCLLGRCRTRASILRAATRSAAAGSLVICYGWRPSGLRRTLAETVGESGTSESVRRALTRCVAQLDEAAEPDVVLRLDDLAVSDGDLGGATVVDCRTDGSEAAGRWRGDFWRTLVSRQP